MRGRRLAACLACAGVTSAHAGPPFLTDDPDPVDRGHAEINLIGQGTRSAGGLGESLSGELNVGCADQVQCHVAVPLARDRPAGAAAQTGLGDIEFGAKVRFVDRPDDGWSAATYPTVFLPTGNARRGLGNGRAQLLLPLWVQRAIGSWRLDAGASLLVNPAPGARDVRYVGVLAQRAFGERLSVGAEVFHRSAPAVGETSSSGFNLGAIVALARDQNLLLSVGRGLTHVDTNRGSFFLAWQLEH